MRLSTPFCTHLSAHMITFYRHTRHRSTHDKSYNIVSRLYPILVIPHPTADPPCIILTPYPTQHKQPFDYCPLHDPSHDPSLQPFSRPLLFSRSRDYNHYSHFLVQHPTPSTPPYPFHMPKPLAEALGSKRTFLAPVGTISMSTVAWYERRCRHKHNNRALLLRSRDQMTSHRPLPSRYQIKIMGFEFSPRFLLAELHQSYGG